VFDYNFFGEHHVAVSESPVPVGPSVLGVRFRRTGKGGTASIVIDDEHCGEIEIPTVMRVISSVGASIGFDHGSAVSERYEAPFNFQGTLERLDIQLVTPRPDDAAASEALSIMSRQ
jgi:arylsulfatase